jgi:hypothetical protein
MTAPKLSPVFPGHIKPVHAGPYKRKYPQGWRYCHFLGYWRMSFCSPDAALNAGPAEASSQTLPWRGLAEKP